MISGENTPDLPAFLSPTITAEALEHEGAAEGFLGHAEGYKSHVKIT